MIKIEAGSIFGSKKCSFQFISGGIPKTSNSLNGLRQDGHIMNLKTTLSKQGIGTSFERDQVYFVSTVFQKDHPYLTSPISKYSSQIKLAGPKYVLEPIVALLAENPKQAMMNHIALARMAISEDRTLWSEKFAEGFLPTHLADSFENIGLSHEPDDFTSPYCQFLLKAAGLNYQG